VYIKKDQVEELVTDIISSNELTITIRPAKLMQLDQMLKKCGRFEILTTQKVACIGLTMVDANEKSWTVFQTLLKIRTREVFALSTIAGKVCKSQVFAL